MKYLFLLSHWYVSKATLKFSQSQAQLRFKNMFLSWKGKTAVKVHRFHRDEHSVPHIPAHFWFNNTAQRLCWMLTLLTENRRYLLPSLPWTLSLLSLLASLESFNITTALFSDYVACSLLTCCPGVTLWC